MIFPLVVGTIGWVPFLCAAAQQNLPAYVQALILVNLRVVSCLCYVFAMFLQCFAVFFYVMLCFAMFLLCFAMVCYVLLCFTMFCYVFAMLCYVWLCFLVIARNPPQLFGEIWWDFFLSASLTFLKPPGPPETSGNAGLRDQTSTKKQNISKGMFFYVLLCFGYVLLCFCYVLLCFPMLCFAMFSYVFLCLPMFSYVFLCFPMFSYASAYRRWNMDRSWRGIRIWGQRPSTLAPRPGEVTENIAKHSKT